MSVFRKILNRLLCFGLVLSAAQCVYAKREVYVVTDPYSLYVKLAVQKYGLLPHHINRRIVILDVPDDEWMRPYSPFNMALFAHHFVPMQRGERILVGLPTNIFDNVMSYFGRDDFSIDRLQMTSWGIYRLIEDMDRRRPRKRIPLSASYAKSSFLQLPMVLLGKIQEYASIADVITFGRLSRYTHRQLAGHIFKRSKEHKMRDYLLRNMLGSPAFARPTYTLGSLIEDFAVVDFSHITMNAYVTQGLLVDYFQRRARLFNTARGMYNDRWEEVLDDLNRRDNPLAPVSLSYIDPLSYGIDSEEMGYDVALEVDEQNRVSRIDISTWGMFFMFQIQEGTRTTGITDQGGIYQLRNARNLQDNYSLSIEGWMNIFEPAGVGNSTNMLELLDRAIYKIIPHLYGGSSAKHMGAIMYSLWEQGRRPKRKN